MGEELDTYEQELLEQVAQECETLEFDLTDYQIERDFKLGYCSFTNYFVVKERVDKFLKSCEELKIKTNEDFKAVYKKRTEANKIKAQLMEFKKENFKAFVGVIKPYEDNLSNLTNSLDSVAKKLSKSLNEYISEDTKTRKEEIECLCHHYRIPIQFVKKIYYNSKVNKQKLLEHLEEIDSAIVTYKAHLFNAYGYYKASKILGRYLSGEDFTEDYQELAIKQELEQDEINKKFMELGSQYFALPNEQVETTIRLESSVENVEMAKSFLKENGIRYILINRGRF